MKPKFIARGQYYQYKVCNDANSFLSSCTLKLGATWIEY